MNLIFESVVLANKAAMKAIDMLTETKKKGK